MPPSWGAKAGDNRADTSREHGGDCSVGDSSCGFGPGMDAVEEVSYSTAHLEAPRTCHNPAVWQSPPDAGAS